MSSSEPIRADGSAWLHFVGVGGSGMSALAHFHAAAAKRGGGLATGSDRAFDHKEREAIRRCLEAAGVRIVPQDGGFASAGAGRTCDGVVASTAVESDVPDHRTAQDRGIPVWHRSELLAAYVREHRTVAVSGTSGKSTVTAMIWSILSDCGLQPGLLTGGPLVALQEQHLLGNAHPAGPAPDGMAPWLVIEADESDGSLVRYEPHVGVILNLGMDHKPPAEVLGMFATFASRTRDRVVMAATDNLRSLRDGAVTFGISEPPVERPDFAAEDPALLAESVAFALQGVRFSVPQPGLHTVLNAVAAIAACAVVGVPLEDMVSPLANFRGVTRRFQSLGSAKGVEVIDDFAHNPDKLAAALATARGRLEAAGSGRLLAVFQPHGFGPTRFLRDPLTVSLADGLRPVDMLWLPEIYFAGGTVVRDISAADLASDIRTLGAQAHFVSRREDLPDLIAAEARPGDLVLIMGARDPSLTELGKAVLQAMGSK